MRLLEGRPEAFTRGNRARFDNLYELMARLAACDSLNAVLGEVLDASIAVMGADGGYIRMFEADDTDPVASTYPFVVHRGISQEYLEYFSRLSQPVDNRARRDVFNGRHVVVDDMTTHPAFAAHREIAVREGYKTLHATPMMSKTGSKNVGVICNYFRDVHTVSAGTKAALDLYAELAASAIDQHQQVTRLVSRNRLLADKATRLTQLLQWAHGRLGETEPHDRDNARSAFDTIGCKIERALAEIASQDDPLDGTVDEIPPENPFGLSRLEMDVLFEAWRGASDTQIAARMGISRFILVKHLRSAMRKLNAETRTQATDLMQRDILAVHDGSRLTIGELLQSFRRRSGLTQAELAEKAGLSHRTISDIERGVRSKTYGSTVELITNALDLEPADAALIAASVDRSRKPRSG